MSIQKTSLITANIFIFEVSDHLSDAIEGSDTYHLRSHCLLKWRQQKLWVSYADHPPAYLLPVLNSRRSLQACLRNSLARAVLLDRKMPLAALEYWAAACHAAGKPVFLRVASGRNLPHKQAPFSWSIKCLLDRLATVLLLTVLSPIFLGLGGLVYCASPGPIIRAEWRVGQRGKLFRMFKFRTTVFPVDKPPELNRANQRPKPDQSRMLALGRWMRRYRLDQLPQLVNVLWGDMSLVGPRPLSVSEALRSQSSVQTRLNALPGMTGVGQKKVPPELAGGINDGINIDAINTEDLDYLHRWSFWYDLQLLLLALPKVLIGAGSYSSH